MTYQVINLGTAPSGAGGDTSRSANVKVNENFTNPQHAASRMVGVDNGNVMEVGAFGVGASSAFVASVAQSPRDIPAGFRLDACTRSLIEHNGKPFGSEYMSGSLLSVKPNNIVSLNEGHMSQLYISGRDLLIRSGYTWQASNKFDVGWVKFYNEDNTTVDANGFIKKASPIIHIFCDRIEPNDEAIEQNPIFEKLGTGHYLIKGTEGFAAEGWWIEVPADTNGNKVCAVEYQTLENGDLEIKTFKKKLNEDGDIVANLDKPIDIPGNSNDEPRWIDIRLNELPKKPTVQRIPRTEKQPKLVKQLKYAPQLTYITKLEDLYDDEGKPVIVGGKNSK